MLATDSKLPVMGGAEKRSYVRSMFSDIAPTYDRLNRIISLSFDLRWRQRAVAQLGWERAPEGIYLDLCAGTMDFGAILARQPGFRGKIVGADFVQPMLVLGRRKAEVLRAVNADALDLPFPDGAFDGAMVGWGIRNLVDLDAGLAEAARVLRPGARLVVLETSAPPHEPLRGFFRLYFEHVLPFVGRFFSKHSTAYTWLPESARVFPEPPALAHLMEGHGFTGVHYELLMGGVTALHVGEKC